MNDRLTFLPRVYTPPRVADYGTLADLTADGGMLMPFGIAGVSLPLVPGPEPPGGPDFPGPPGGSSSVPLGDTSSGGGLGAGEGPGSVAGQSFPGGEGGGGAGGVVSTGGGDASLPFTGFPAAMAAAIGAGLAGAGAAMRRALRRD
jgi:hypothetical protein